AAAMWNVSLALEYVDPAKLKITAERARTLSRGLRDSSQAALRRAVKLDRTVSARSAFVNMALGDNESSVAESSSGMASNLDSTPGGQPHLVLQAAPIARYNDRTGSLGLGMGAELAVAFATSPGAVMPLIGVGFGVTHVSNADGDYSHTLLSAAVGFLSR